MRTTCFWSIMALNNLEFVYIPSAVRNIKISEQTIGDLLLNRSLYEIMHPNEIDLAKSDLSTFFQLKTLAGSVTRCRLLPLQNIADLYATQKRTQENFKYNSVSATNQNEISWSIVDLVIYTATNDTVLMCIHNTDLELYCQHGNIKSLKTSCQSRDSFTEEDVSSLAQIMLEKEVTRTAPNQLPIRIFQIVDQLSGLPLFIWPPNLTPTDTSQMNNINELVQTISKEMLLKEFKSSTFDQQQNEILCTRHFYASSKHKFLEELCLFQRILIPYGNIIFESFQVSSMQDIKPITSSMIHQHYYKDVAQPLLAPPPSLQLQLRQQQQQQHETMMKDDGKFYNSIHNIVSRPTSASATATELAIGEIEHQMLPGNLLAAVTTRSQEDDLYHDQFNQSPSSLFQKFRLNQHVVNQESSSPIERRRKFVYNGQQHHPFLTPGINDGNGSNNVKVCTRCRTSNSPEWRRGPDGHKTLCNACGLRYSRFRSKQWRTAANNKQ